MAAKRRRSRLEFLVPLVVAGVFAALNLVGFYGGAERRFYDLLLHLKPAVPERRELVFLDIDDTAIANVGVFPWGRDIMADGLILLRELGAAYAVFDIEYTERSPQGVDARLLEQEVPELFDREFASIKGNVEQLVLSLRKGLIPLADAQDYVRDLGSLTDMSKNLLLGKVQAIARDNDAYLGQAARLFGKAYFTVNLLPEADPAVPAALKEYALQNETLRDARPQPGFRGSRELAAADIRPAIRPVLEGGRGAGFVNVVVDGDGVRRRIDLVREYDGRLFGQLAFVPLLDWLGGPEVELQRGRILLRGARLPGGEVKDIAIPLDPEGRFLINWPKKSYQESFRHFPFYTLVLHKRLETRLLHNLRLMEQAGYLSYFQGSYALMDAQRYAEGLLQEVLQGGDAGLMRDYADTRRRFFDDLGAYLQGPAQEQILARLEALLASAQVSEADKQGYREIQAEVPGIFSSTQGLYRELAELRDQLRQALAGSFCVIGLTATSTSDIGVNPFQAQYMNVGTHAAIVNTILTGQFLNELPWWYAAVAAAALALLGTWAIRRLDPLPSILVALGFVAAILGAGTGFFLLTGVYPRLLTPALTVGLTLLVLILVKFLVLAREKSELRTMFSHYLSNDVINDLLSHPEKLELGGDKKYLSALFTDVRGFSTISEQLDPADLVKLLNAYLTEMSNIILDLKGTIDKYEGDAIIAFFCAPVELEDHAHRACLAAVRMKKMERYLNDHFLQEKLSPTPLLTRVGINTGDMVVGNMGTARKMDYTVMGHAVNLASRLEGVNKQYATWVLISEYTSREIGDRFTLRRMDPVRVVGIERPVRLYELIDEKEETDAATLEAVDLFHRGQALYEERRWQEAIDLFQKVQAILPGDGPSGLFINRCRGYQENPPAQPFPVFPLTMK